MIRINKNSVLVGVAVLAIVITGALVSTNIGFDSVSSFLKLNFGMSKDAIAKNTVGYINKNLLQSGQTAELVSYSEESGLIKIKIEIGSQSFNSYVTKDGKFLFPEPPISLPSLSPKSDQNSQAETKQNPANLTKVDKPLLEAYVVSGCPYGLQMQRAMTDAAKNVPSLAQNIKVRYIGAISDNTITAMHGPEEAAENLRQICIRDEQNSKYWNYISCYVKKAAGTMANGMPIGDTKTCQATAGIDTAKLNSCVKDANRGLAYAKEDFVLDSKYNIQGSPTLILNGTQISEDAFGGRSSDSMRNIVCSSYLNPPDFCKTKLNTAPAATSFSLTYAGSGSGNSGGTGSNCVSAQ